MSDLYANSTAFAEVTAHDLDWWLCGYHDLDWWLCGYQGCKCITDLYIYNFIRLCHQISVHKDKLWTEVQTKLVIMGCKLAGIYFHADNRLYPFSMLNQSPTLQLTNHAIVWPYHQTIQSVIQYSQYSQYSHCSRCGPGSDRSNKIARLVDDRIVSLTDGMFINSTQSNRSQSERTNNFRCKSIFIARKISPIKDCLSHSLL